MEFNCLCNRIAAKALEKPGTVVERMNNYHFLLEKGRLYNVSNQPSIYDNMIKLEGIESFLATRFRKENI